MVLVACEESQVVCKAFRGLGHEAYSCDIIPCSGGHPEWHIQGDALKILNDGWDLLIAHPPCTRICNSGVSWLNRRNLWDEMREASVFFRKFIDAPVKHICVENPIPHKYAMEIIGQRYAQTIQPWQFGDDASKRTCLWLRNLPKLKPTDVIVKTRYANQTPSGRDKTGPSPERARIRSKTYQGIADAMADQWSAYMANKNHIIQASIPFAP